MKIAILILLTITLIAVATVNVPNNMSPQTKKAISSAKQNNGAKSPLSDPKSSTVFKNPNTGQSNVQSPNAGDGKKGCHQHAGQCIDKDNGCRGRCERAVRGGCVCSIQSFDPASDIQANTGRSGPNNRNPNNIQQNEVNSPSTNRAARSYSAQ